MSRAFVNKELSIHGVAKAAFGQHAANCAFNDPGRVFGEDLPRRCRFLTAGITTVREIDLVIHLFAGKADLSGVDNDDVVTAIHVRCEAGLVLAHQQVGHTRRKAANNLAFRVDDMPFPSPFRVLGVCRLETRGIHWSAILMVTLFRSGHKGKPCTRSQSLLSELFL